MVETELDGTRTNRCMEKSRLNEGTRTGDKESPSQDLHHSPKSYDFTVRDARNQQETTARSFGESPQLHHQNRSIEEVIRTESDTGEYNTRRGGHATETSSTFHGGISDKENSSDSTRIPVTNFKNLQQGEDTQGNDTGMAPIDTSRTNVVHANKSHLNSGIEHRRNENDQLTWVAKEQGKSNDPTKQNSGNTVKISLPELPWRCYNKEFVSGLLSPIGKALYLDSASIKKTRGSQATVKVQVDITQKIPPYIWMGYIGEDITDGRWQKIEYDNIPDYCFYCKHQGNLESDCTIRQRDEDKKKRELEKVNNKHNKDRDNNPQQTKGHKEIDHKEDNNQQYQQQREQEHMYYQQEDQWQTQRRRNNNPPQAPRDNTRQVEQPTKQLDIVSKQVTEISRGKAVSTGQAVTGIDSMLPFPNPIDKVVNTIAEVVVGGLDGKGQETNTNLHEGVSKGGELTHGRHEELDIDHSRDSRSPSTLITNQQKIVTPQATDIGQSQGRFNNKSGDRLSKKKREVIKKRLQQSTRKILDGIDTGKQPQDHDVVQVNKGNRVKVPPDDYGALNSEDEIDSDNQSMDESDEDAEDTMKYTCHVFGSSFQDKSTDVQRITEQQGLFPRGRKQTRHNPHQPITSMSDTSSKPMTRSKSKGY
ncbi:hypothetical protein KY284_028987 [Solanum tuberosum]|nr:hypothetical protein KY284_028987 [Solanum tuberosum]